MGYPRINEQHEYIGVDFGNSRRLTTSFGGQKASGAIPNHVFKAWCAMVDAKGGPVLGERIKAFADGIAAIWPEWNVPPRAFNIGDEVAVNFGRKGVRRGTIVAKKRTTYSVRFPAVGASAAFLCSCPADLLAQHNPVAS